MCFLSSFVEESAARRASRQPLFEERWAEREALRAELLNSAATIGQFFHALEVRLNIEDALATGGLEALRDEGFLEERCEHLTTTKLRRANGLRAWTIDIATRGLFGIKRDSEGLDLGSEVHRVELVVSLDREKNRIDTEFFSLNTLVDGELNPFDDREKLHIVWESDDDGLSLVYLGLGTNEPYDSEHPERSARSRPRYYIYDRDDSVRSGFAVTWTELGEFDWNWTLRPPEQVGDGWRVFFVVLPDGTRVCISDPEVVHAAQHLTRERVFDGFAWRLFPDPTDPVVYEDLDERVRAQFGGLFQVVSAVVRKFEGPGEEAPDLNEVLSVARLEYLPYFLATCAITTRSRAIDDLRKILPRMEPSRREEYVAIFERECSTVFEEQWLEHLPTTMGELASTALDDLPTDLKTCVADWLEHIRSELTSDLYYYGQDPSERIAYLLLGAHIALNNGIYDGILDQARVALQGGEAMGCFKLFAE